MCGIAGKVTFDGSVVGRDEIARMCATLVHRGPDDEGIWTGPGVGLGQRRLAIIDLDHRAAAPLPNEDETVWVTFNGEIYNFRELRGALQSRGHRFRTEGDTEVLALLYREYGPSMVSHLRGMFAFAIWDVRRRQLFAARDRLGKKPFVYARTPSSLVFGSELAAVLADDSVSVAPDFHAIDQYLTYQYVPAPLTAFAGIEKLPAAHTLMCSADGTVKVERYWEPPVGPTSGEPEEALADSLRDVLREAVRMRLVSDVPLGAFLSGGIDSATVVALMAEVAGRVKTFSIGFEEEKFNELPWARLVAERYSTDHHEMVVKTDAAAVIPLLVRHFGEPFADSSALPTYYVSKLTREHVTVALSGDGGDENFSGYENYATVLRWSRADAIPGWLRRAVAHPAASVLSIARDSRTAGRLRRGLAMAAAGLPGRFLLQTSILKPDEKAAAYTPKFRQYAGGRPSPVSLPWSPDMDSLDWMAKHDQMFYLPDCLMVKVDIASMANSLEVRAPLLDHEVVEFAATIPSSMKRDRTGGKRILKKAVAPLVPAAILTKKKTGFGLPVAHWFRTDLAPLLRETLLDDRSARRGLFETGFLRRMVDEHARGARDWSHRLWALMFLELWFREWID